MAKNLTNVVAAIQAEWAAGKYVRSSRAGRAMPFVTIARQSGAGGHRLAHLLAERLKQERPGGPTWRPYDRELVEKVAQDHKLSAILIETLGDDERSWLSDVVGGRPDELALLRRVAATMRALAEAGHAIIVGRGSVFITRDMPGGLHVRLVAPFDCRVRRKAEQLGISEKKAAARLSKTDENRRQFYDRYFPDATLSAETFALTLNTSVIPDEKQLELVLQLIPEEPAPSKRRS